MSYRCSKAILCAMLLVSAAHADPWKSWRYAVTNIDAKQLGTLGGGESVARDINDQGEIVGWARDSTGTKRAFLYRDAAMEDITLLPFVVGEAHGINNHTQVVGFIGGANGGNKHAFYRSDTHRLALLDEASNWPDCLTGASAHAINDDGVITGERQNLCPIFQNGPQVAMIERAVRWKTFTANWKEMFPFIIAPTSSYAHNINARGVIVGEELAGEASFTGAYFWGNGNDDDVPAPASTPPELFYPSTARAFGINTNGEIVGSMDLWPDGFQKSETVGRAIYWDGESPQSERLAIFSDGRNAGARDINDQQFVVGWGDRLMIPAGYQNRAALWHADFGITMLPLPAGYGDGPTFNPNVCEAYAVTRRSDSGLVQAVGYCRLNGKLKAILWNITTAKVTKVLPGPGPIAGPN